MKTPALKIGSSYVLFSIVYFILAWLFSLNNPYPRNNIAGKFFFELHDIFFWGKAYVIFILSIIISAAIGTIYCYCKSSTVYYLVFRKILIFSVLMFVLLIIISNMWFSSKWMIPKILPKKNYRSTFISYWSKSGGKSFFFRNAITDLEAASILMIR